MQCLMINDQIKSSINTVRKKSWWMHYLMMKLIMLFLYVQPFLIR